MKRILWSTGIFLIAAAQAFGGLSTSLTPSETTLTIYQNAPITLVTEAGSIPLRGGADQLHLTWRDQVDPTSLHLELEGGSVAGVRYPSGVRGSAIFELQAPAAGDAPFRFSYLHGGLRADVRYDLRLDAGGTHATLRGSTNISNRSGEDFRNVRLQLLVGNISLLEGLHLLTGRDAPYGRPDGDDHLADYLRPAAAPPAKVARARMAMAEMVVASDEAIASAEGLSDYAVLPLGKRVDLAAGWQASFPLISAEKIPVSSRYLHDEARYGSRTIHLVRLANSTAGGLGKGPLPGGNWRVYQGNGAGSERYLAAASGAMTPTGGELDLDLGVDPAVEVEVRLLEQRTHSYRIEKERIVGWRDLRTWEVTVVNRRENPVRAEIVRPMQGEGGSIEHFGEHGTFERLDHQRGRYLIDLPAKSRRTFRYQVTGDFGKVTD